MKNLVHLVSSLNTGGAEKFVMNLSAQQKREGLNVDIISFGHPSDTFQPVIESNGIRVINITGNVLVRCLQLLNILKRYDVVHIHSPAVIRALYPISWFIQKLNIVYTIHGEIDPAQSLLKKAHLAALKYINVTTAVSEPAKASVAHRYDWNSNSIHVINNGIIVPTALDKSKSNKIRLATVSRLIPLKNIGLLFDVLSELPSKISNAFTIDVFGDGPEEETLKRKAAQLDLLDSINFKGNVVHEKDIYNHIDVLVLCSITEGLPMSILEAMAHKVPVISSNVGAIPNIIQHANNGWLFDVNKSEELITVLKNIHNDSSQIEHLGQLAQDFVKADFSIETTSKEFHELYMQNYV